MANYLTFNPCYSRIYQKYHPKVVLSFTRLDEGLKNTKVLNRSEHHHQPLILFSQEFQSQAEPANNFGESRERDSRITRPNLTNTKCNVDTGPSKKKLKALKRKLVIEKYKNTSKEKDDFRVKICLISANNLIQEEAKAKESLQKSISSDELGVEQIGKAKQCYRHLSKAEKIARKNKKVEAYRLRNVYKFILKHTHSFVQRNAKELIEDLRSRGFKEIEIEAATTFIYSLRSETSQTEILKKSREKVDQLSRQDPAVLIIFRRALLWMLKGLRDNRFYQVIEKNKKVYEEGCESYLGRIETTLTFLSQGKAGNN